MKALSKGMEGYMCLSIPLYSADHDGSMVSVTVDACIVAVRMEVIMELDLGPLSNHENLTQGGRGRLGIYG